MNGTTYTSGNLALAYEPAHTAFTVVNGTKGLGSASTAAAAPVRPHARRVASYLCAVAIVIGAVFAGLSFLSLDQTAYDQALASSDRLEIVVQPSDTLWSIADTHPADGVGTRETVSIVRAWNDLSDGMLRAGQRLVVPAR